MHYHPSGTFQNAEFALFLMAVLLVYGFVLAELENRGIIRKHVRRK